jgi:acyl dehydratase
MPQVTERFFEDFAVGQRFRSGTATVTAERIKSFAAEFDPQSFHVDEDAARDSLFAGLAASGWHTAAIAMRLLVESDLKPAGGTIGAGVEDLRWPRPVRPGDVLHIQSEVVDVRASRSRPDLGIVKVRATLYNQSDEPVQLWTPVLMVRRRPA